MSSTVTKSQHATLFDKWTLAHLNISLVAYFFSTRVQQLSRGIRRRCCRWRHFVIMYPVCTPLSTTIPNIYQLPFTNNRSYPLLTIGSNHGHQKHMEIASGERRLNWTR